MKTAWFGRLRTIGAFCGMSLMMSVPGELAAEPTAAAVAFFDSYSRAVESRLVRQHRSADGFLAAAGGAGGRALEPELRIEPVQEPMALPATDLSGAMLHHWRGTAFAAGALAADFERLMRDFRSYPQHFAPQVLQARTLTEDGDRMQAWMRVRQHHVITVVMDGNYDVTFGRVDGQHGYSISRSTRFGEIEGAGTAAEHVLGAREEHGFLWRLNTYWSYEERDGGLYMQVEVVSLTRSIPRGLRWAIQPYAESIPRESLEFTLRSACGALRK